MYVFMFQYCHFIVYNTLLKLLLAIVHLYVCFILPAHTHLYEHQFSSELNANQLAMGGGGGGGGSVHVVETCSLH